MNRVGKLPGNGRFILLASQEEYLEMQAKGFKITDSVPLKQAMFGFTKTTPEDGEPLVSQEYHESILWKLCEDFFDIQIRRNPSNLRFGQLAKFNTLIRQGRPLTPAQKKLYKQELIRRNQTLELWYTKLKEIEGMGYKDEYIYNVIKYAENDVATREMMRKNPRWHGWAAVILSLNTLLQKSSNGISKWENLVASYERTLQQKYMFGDFTGDEIFEV